MINPKPTTHAHPPFDVRLFAHIPNPKKPKNIAVDRTKTVYIDSSTKGDVDDPPSKMFAFDSNGKLEREYTIQDQDRSNPLYKLYNIALDNNGLLYIIDVLPPRIVMLNPHTNTQHNYTG